MARSGGGERAPSPRHSSPRDRACGTGRRTHHGRAHARGGSQRGLGRGGSLVDRQAAAPPLLRARDGRRPQRGGLPGSGQWSLVQPAWMRDERRGQMPGYTLVNLKSDVEDMAPKFGMGDGLESRFARRSLEMEKYGLSYFRA